MSNTSEVVFGWMGRHLELLQGFLCGCGFLSLILGLSVTAPWTTIAPIWAVSPPWAVIPQGAWGLFAVLVALIIYLGEFVLFITAVSLLLALSVLLIRRAQSWGPMRRLMQRRRDREAHRERELAERWIEENQRAREREERESP